MPSHAHGQGYSDINFMIPELVAGVQFSKGPYYAEQGDFATAGAANTNYVTSIDRPLARLEIGGQGYARALLAGSHEVPVGQHARGARLSHNDGPWVQPDAFPRSQRRRAVQPGRCRQWLYVDRDGLSRPVDFDRYVPRRALTTADPSLRDA